MIDKGSDDYKIAVNELGRTVALAIDKFKKLVGCDRCSIETTDYEYNASTTPVRAEGSRMAQR